MGDRGSERGAATEVDRLLSGEERSDRNGNSQKSYENTKIAKPKNGRGVDFLKKSLSSDAKKLYGLDLWGESKETTFDETLSYLLHSTPDLHRKSKDCATGNTSFLSSTSTNEDEVFNAEVACREKGYRKRKMPIIPQNRSSSTLSFNTCQTTLVNNKPAKSCSNLRDRYRYGGSSLFKLSIGSKSNIHKLETVVEPPSTEIGCLVSLSKSGVQTTVAPPTHQSTTKAPLIRDTSRSKSVASAVSVLSPGGEKPLHVKRTRFSRSNSEADNPVEHNFGPRKPRKFSLRRRPFDEVSDFMYFFFINPKTMSKNL